MVVMRGEDIMRERESVWMALRTTSMLRSKSVNQPVIPPEVGTDETVVMAGVSRGASVPPPPAVA